MSRTKYFLSVILFSAGIGMFILTITKNSWPYAIPAALLLGYWYDMMFGDLVRYNIGEREE